MVETVPVPLLVLDDRMVVRSANPAFLNAFRLDRTEVLERPFLALGHGMWDQPLLRDKLLTVLPAHTEFRSLELTVSVDGLGTRFLILNARQIELEGEGHNLILLSMQDITLREELRAQVQRQLIRAERSNRDLQEFAHSASHDLQEPLRKIRTYAERLKERLPPETLGETERKYLERMAEAAERMQQRIDDILSLGRLGRIPPARTPVPLAPLLQAVIEDLEVSVESSTARLEVGPLPEVMGDPAQLRLLFQNLLSNAIKFRHPERAPQIQLDGIATDTELRVTIRDNGIGFDPEYAERIFRPFERLHGRGGYEGTGIGLSICRRIMENHDGSIEATATPGEGARFTLRFPKSQNPTHA